MIKRKRAGDTPIGVNVLEGNSYYWCTCGLSTKQPFCDGAHVETDNQPYMYKAEKTKEVYFCGCKKSKNFPLCDGSHNNLKN